MALLERRPVVLQQQKSGEIVALEKRIGLSFEADRGARAHPVVVPGPDCDLVGKNIEEPLKAFPFEAGVPFVGCAADLADEKQIARHQQPIRWFVHDEMVFAVAGRVQDAEGERADCYLLTVQKRNRWRGWTRWMCRDRRAGQLDRLVVAVDVVGMAVRVEDASDLQALIGRPLNQDFRRVRRVDQNRLAGCSVAQQVSEISITARSYLFEDELHITRRAAESLATQCKGRRRSSCSIP